MPPGLSRMPTRRETGGIDSFRGDFPLKKRFLVAESIRLPGLRKLPEAGSPLPAIAVGDYFRWPSAGPPAVRGPGCLACWAARWARF